MRFKVLDEQDNYNYKLLKIKNKQLDNDQGRNQWFRYVCQVC